MTGITIGVVGNPNCGKTTLFNALTGSTQQVGNWPGVTVEKKVGAFTHAGTRCTVVDLPGVYSLGVVSTTSEDERVARDYVLAGEADLVVNIVDASNMERNLYLTAQLLEMRVPLVVVLNMMDIAHDRGLEIDIAEMSARLGCPVVPVVATRRRGLDDIRSAILAMAADPRLPDVTIPYPEEITPHIDALAAEVAAKVPADAGHPVWLATKLLEGDMGARSAARAVPEASIASRIAAIEEATDDEADILIADARFGYITALVAASVRRPREASRTLSDRIDQLVLNRVLGIPLFLGMMYLMFLFTINVGGAFIDFFDQAFSVVLVDGLSRLLGTIGAPDWFVVLAAEGAGGGITTVATFVPVIAALFLFLSVLEDSGYMARAAFVMDRAMRAIGLPGKAFVPMIVGFGCNVPSIMATRTLEHRRDRVLATMMAPFMSCGARLPVYALFAAVFFPVGGQNVVFGLYLLGILFAVGTGLMLKHSLLRGEASAFVMELPPYHMPTLGAVLIRSWTRLRGFILRASRVIVPMVIILSFFNALGTNGTFGNQDSQDSVLAATSRVLMPVFEPMGVTSDNWPAAVGLVTGLFAKEAVVGTLNSLYSQMDEAAAGGAGDEAFDLGAGLWGAVLTIPENLSDLASAFTDPLGIDVSYVADRQAAAEELEVGDAAFGAMAAGFAGPAGAFAYMLLILLYVPCVAALGAMAHEVGLKWTVFSAAWTTGLGYCASVVFFQASRLSTAPAEAGLIIAVALGLLGLVVVTLRIVSRTAITQSATAPAE